MRIRALVPAVALLLLLAGCGDDSPSTGTGTGGTGSATTAVGPTAPPTTAGPSTGEAACADLSHRYVRLTRIMFDREGAPSDQLVDETRARMSRLDQIAGAAGCGDAYTENVCQGMDDLTHEGILVIIPLTTAQCL